MEQYKKIEDELIHTDRLQYYVSNLGNVKRVHKSTNKEKIMKPWIHKDGYRLVELGSKQCRVAKLVGLTFLAKPESPSHTIDHIDRNRCNDNVANLRWASKSEQIKNSSRYRDDITETNPVLRKKILMLECRERLGYNEKIQCHCGKLYTKYRKTRHEKTDFHQEYIKNNNNL